MSAVAPRAKAEAILIILIIGGDGYRGVYHRAGRRPDPLAPSIPRTPGSGRCLSQPRSIASIIPRRQIAPDSQSRSEIKAVGRGDIQSKIVCHPPIRNLYASAIDGTRSAIKGSAGVPRCELISAPSSKLSPPCGSCASCWPIRSAADKPHFGLSSALVCWQSPWCGL